MYPKSAVRNAVSVLQPSPQIGIACWHIVVLELPKVSVVMIPLPVIFVSCVVVAFLSDSLIWLEFGFGFFLCVVVGIKSNAFGLVVPIAKFLRFKYMSHKEGLHSCQT